ncbi:MAG: BMC domain-containing protein [Clostridiaceae bacterium]|nr:BMC domain-containing protein [Clostridiaceae bacterium]
MTEGVGFLEVYGLTAAFVAADAACKAANVRIDAFDHNKPANADKLPVPLLVLVKMRGSIDNVKAAMEAGAEAAKKVSGVATTHVIARPQADTEKLLKINSLMKK